MLLLKIPVVQKGLYTDICH